MATINKMADIFFMPERKIIILLGGKVIEIGDNELNDVSLLLRTLYYSPISIDDLHVSEDLKMAVGQLRELGVITDNFFQQESVQPIFPFLPNKINGKLWVVRRGDKFYFFNSSTSNGALRMAKRMSLSWIDEVESGVVTAMFLCRAECLSAKISVPYFCKLSKNKFQEGSIWELEENSPNVIVHPSESNGDFWSKLIDRTVWGGGLIPLIKQVPNLEKPFHLSLPTYLTSHKLHSFGGCNLDWQVGRDSDPVIAKGKAIMESIERYCGKKKIEKYKKKYASYLEIGEENCLNPLDFAKYSKYQFEKGWLKGVKTFEKKNKMNWVAVKEWEGDKEMFIPECFISYSYDEYNQRNPLLFYANSNGMAAHTEIRQAVKSAALELIERDSIMIHWFNRISPPKMVFSDKDLGPVGIFRKKLASCGYLLEILDLTLDTVPVIMAIAIKKDSDSLSFFCGAAAAEKKIEAIEKSIEELEFSFWDRFQYPDKLSREVDNLDIRILNEPIHHEMVYLKSEMACQVRFLNQGNTQVYQNELLIESFDVFQSLKRIGSKLYYADMTAREITELDLGISVVRVLIPKFIPITFGYGYEPLAMDRLYKLPVKMGYPDRLTEQEMIERYLPHFFA